LLDCRGDRLVARDTDLSVKEPLNRGELVDIALVKTASRLFHNVLDYWPYILLLVPVFIITFPLLEPGAILNQDFPFVIHALTPSKVLYTWVDFGSTNNFENIARLPETITGLALLTIGITPEWISKLMVIVVFYLASVSFYFFARGLLTTRVNSQFQLKVAAVVGSIFYAYNT